MQLVELASKFSSKISITKDSREVDCKNMIAVLTLGATQGTELEVSADGDDADDAIESICGLIEVGFGEE